MATLDRFHRPLADLRVSVTDRCNFRCPYCMPREVFGPAFEFLKREKLLTFEEIVRLTRLFVELGANKVRVTGGEPLMRRNLPELIQMLSAIDGLDDLTLTTNGVLLARDAEVLAEAGLGRVTVSLDSLDDAVFQAMNDVGRPVADVLAGIEAAERADLTPIKINAVVQRGVNDHTLVDLARHFKGSGHIVRFIEYMDVGNTNGWRMDEVVTAAEIHELIHGELPLEPLEPNYRGEVARRWAHADGGGEIGIIASVSQPFCGDCTRARLSPEGRFFTCLFASEGRDLRALVRSGADDDALLEALGTIWGAREDRYSEQRSEATLHQPKVEMSHIGG